MLVEQIKSEFRRRVFEESYERINICLDQLTEDQIWKKPNANTNSIGNLILHLMGNVRQYICSGVGGQKDIRKRDDEFLLSSRCTNQELLEKLSLLKTDVEKVIESLTEEKLLDDYKVQGFDEKGTAIIIHVIEHFSYHIGQVALYTKLLVDRDLGFYAGLDLNIKSS